MRLWSMFLTRSSPWELLGRPVTHSFASPPDPLQTASQDADREGLVSLLAIPSHLAHALPSFTYTLYTSAHLS